MFAIMVSIEFPTIFADEVVGCFDLAAVYAVVAPAYRANQQAYLYVSTFCILTVRTVQIL